MHANQAGEDVGGKATSSQDVGFKELAFKGYGADLSTSSARVSTAHKTIIIVSYGEPATAQILAHSAPTC
jgi:hypothetical protein